MRYHTRFSVEANIDDLCNRHRSITTLSSLIVKLLLAYANEDAYNDMLAAINFLFKL